MSTFSILLTSKFCCDGFVCCCREIPHAAPKPEVIKVKIFVSRVITQTMSRQSDKNEMI